MTDFLEKYPFVEIIQTISEATFAPKVSIKFKNGETIIITLNMTDIKDNVNYMENQIEKEILKHRIVQREKKLERILK